jgi:hypothetical protein
MPFDVGPHDTVDRKRFTVGIDVGEYPQILSARELFDKRTQNFPVGRGNEFGRGDHLILRLERHLA